MSRPDQCPQCGSLNYIAFKNGKRYNPFADRGLWDECQCEECGKVWPFRIVQVYEVQNAN